MLTEPKKVFLNLHQEPENQLTRWENSDPRFELEERFNPKKISGFLQKKFSILATRGLDPSRTF